MENQCYSHEPHWELSKKEVKKRVPLRGIEPRKNHYGKFGIKYKKGRSFAFIANY